MKLVFEPQQALLKGLITLVDAIRPTFGPVGGHVGVSDASTPPEMLDDAGTIARRIIALPQRTADVGAMLVRAAIWRQHEYSGDGTTLTAILIESLVKEGMRWLASGGDAALLRHHLDAELPAILRLLDEQCTPVTTRDQITHLAQSISGDEEASECFGEVFEMIGADGTLNILSGYGRAPDVEYIQGSYWEGGLWGRKRHVELYEPSILLTDLSLQSAEQVMTFLRECYQRGIRQFVLMADALSERLVNLIDSSQGAREFHILPVKVPGRTATEKLHAIQDLALLTGATPLYAAAGQSLDDFRMEYLGTARRAWANDVNFGIVNGGGDRLALCERIQALRTAAHHADQPAQRTGYQRRIGRLLGGSATLWVGGASQDEIEARKKRLTRTALVIRAAMRDGVLPGGGVAFTNCLDHLDGKLQQAHPPDQAAAYRMLKAALQAPAMTLIANAGFEPMPGLTRMRAAGADVGFDVKRGRLCCMREAGIWDASSVLKHALSTAVRTAGLFLTIQVVFHHKHPVQATTP